MCRDRAVLVGLLSLVTATRKYRNNERSEDHPRQGRLAGNGQATRQCQPSLQDDGLDDLLPLVMAVSRKPRTSGLIR